MLTALDQKLASLVTAPAYQVTEIWRPREAEGRQAGQLNPAQRAALTAAYHAGAASSAGGMIAFGWVRTAAGGPVHILTAGEALVGSADAKSREVLLTLPGGARGTMLRPAELAWLTGQLGSWREVAGISDPLLTGRVADGQTAGHPAVSLNEGLLGNWTGPFGWLVIAESVRRPELRHLLEDVGSRQRAAAGAADRFPAQSALAARLAARHAELGRGESAGIWRITVLAGGTDAASAARVAGLLCASADLDGLPYALSPAPADAGGAPAETDPGGDGTPSSPFYGSTDLLAALARAPDSEVPGVRLTLRPEFDVTPEPGTGEPGAEIGHVLDQNLVPSGPFTVSAESLNRHVLICGATGGGKSQTVRSLLEAATRLGIPWLVVEPAKAEYRLMPSRIPGKEVVRIRLGEPDAVAAGLNPLEPAVAADGSRFPLQTHADLVRALFVASFQADEPFPQVLSAALTQVYEDAGWDLALGEPTRAEREPVYPTLTGLQNAAEQVVAGIGYSQRVTEDVLGFIRVRLASLRHGTAGRFLEGGHLLDFGALLRKNVVLELEDVGDDADKAFLMGAVLIRLVEHLRVAQHGRQPPVLRHLTVIEEAHRLLRQPGSGSGSPVRAANHAVELFAGLLAEVRAYGEGLVIAEQIPGRLVPDVIKNTAVKIVHRLPAADDRGAVGATINATAAQSRYLVTLPAGQAAAFADGMDYPVLIQVTDGTHRERAQPGTSDARSLVSSRAASCGRECTDRPCTLREMRQAQRVLEDETWVGPWGALAVFAHLTGWPTPVPVPQILAALRGLPVRTAQCAISHAVSAAVALHPGIGRPAGLAAHVSAVLRARTERAEWLCADDEPEWLLDQAVTIDLTDSVLRVVVKDGAASLVHVLASFIDCRWPVRYFQAGPSSD